MDLSAIIILAALVSILANLLKVWEFGNSRLLAAVTPPTIHTEWVYIRR
ncbi:MAG TPA: hypothetical protein VGQ08_12385 [Nitrospiraceae bacterium]|jgi:hypothetical protein|nr:hypothetical protein [Nitrospiraceae bacterium]